MMRSITEYYESMPDKDKQDRLKKMVNWTLKEFPNLSLEIKWNQPMFTDHKTYIMAYSFAKNHISVAPEKVILDRHLKAIIRAGYKHTKMLFHIRYDQKIDYGLLKLLIQDTIKEKKDFDKFWL